LLERGREIAASAQYIFCMADRADETGKKIHKPGDAEFAGEYFPGNFHPFILFQ
jgi:hypothetical protein